MYLAKQDDFKHIVVTLGAGESNRSVLEAAVQLAATLGAELEGGFIEDADLIRLAELPFTREVRSWPSSIESLSGERLQRELRAMARQAERMLEQTVAETGVSWSFRVWRGSAATASLARTFEADVLSLGRTGSRVYHKTRLLPVSRRKSLRYTVNAINVLFTDSAQAARALVAACQLAKHLDVPLSILLAGDEKETGEMLEKAAVEILDANAMNAQFTVLSDFDISTLVRTVNATDNTVLIAEADHPLMQNANVDQCLETLACPLLLVR